MQNRISLRKVLFYHHITTLPEHNLAKDCLLAQKGKLPGIATEMFDILNSWNITNVESYTKWSFKRFMKMKIARKNTDELFEWSKGYKKINLDSYEVDLKIKDYLKTLSLKNARMIFRQNCRLIQTIRTNFKSDKRYLSEKYLCPDCRHLETPVTHVDEQDLLTSCEGNRDLRDGLDLRDLSQLAEYFRRVIDRRNQRYGG